MARRWFLLSVGVSIALLVAPASGWAFTPRPGSPMALKQHPRMHVTQATLPALRQAIEQHYLSEFQQTVDWAAASWNDQEGLGEHRHDILEEPIVFWAFISLLGEIPGVNYPKTPTEFGRHAIDELISKLGGSGEISFAVPMVYDWTYDLMTPAERQTIADRAKDNPIGGKATSATLENPSSADDRDMTSSKYYESCYAFYIGLAFWGDGTIDAVADGAVDSFRDFMLDYRRLDIHQWLAGDNGGVFEAWGYAAWHPKFHYLFLDAWRTATGENYFVESARFNGSVGRTLAEFLLYHIDPHPYFGTDHLFMRGGSVEPKALDVGDFSAQVFYLGRTLTESGLTTQSGLLRHLADTYSMTMSRYVQDWMFPLLGTLRAYPAVTPEASGMRPSRFFRNLGQFVARTGFREKHDSVFAATDAHFAFAGHDGIEDYPGFALLKYGELINTRQDNTKGHGNANDYPGGYSGNVVYFDGSGSSPTRTARRGVGTNSEFQKAATGEMDSGTYADNGGIEQITRLDRDFYHVRTNRTRQFIAEENRSLDSDMGRAHTREYVWLPGANPATDSDFLVIYDRTEATDSNVYPRWVYHTANKPIVAGSSSDISTGSGESDRHGFRYAGAREVKARSAPGPDDFQRAWGTHGVAFVRTLLPTATDIEISRVAQMNSSAANAGENYELKINRWQVDVIPATSAVEHRFLHVLQVGDDNRLSAMTDASVLASGDGRLEGAFIERPSVGRAHLVALFAKDHGVVEGAVSYDVDTGGSVRHYVTGLEPAKEYRVSYGGTELLVTTQWDVQLWDYNGVATNFEAGVLAFETSSSGPMTVSLTPVQSVTRPPGLPSPYDDDGLTGPVDITSPGPPRNLRIR